MVALLMGVLMGGCAHAEGLAGRSLSLSRDEHQLALAAGPRLRTQGENRLRGAGFIAYRYGISNRVDYHLPFGAGYAWTASKRTTTAVAGGITGFTAREVVREAASERLGREVTRTHYLLPLRASLAVKRIVDSSNATVATLAYQHVFDLSGGRDTSGATASGAWIVDVTDWLSLTLAVSGSGYWEQKDAALRAAIELGGTASDGYGPLPLFSFHLLDGLDLMIAPGVSFELTENETDVSCLVGFDWRPL